MERHNHPQERRKIVLHLTEEGKYHLQQSLDQTRTHIADILNELTPEQVSQIEQGLTLLKNVFEKTEIKSL